MFLLAGGMSA